MRAVRLRSAGVSTEAQASVHAMLGRSGEARASSAMSANRGRRCTHMIRRQPLFGDNIVPAVTERFRR